MNCPKCGKEMLRGSMHTQKYPFWTQQELRTLLVGHGWEIEGEQLLEAGFPLVWLRCRAVNP